MEYMTSWKVEKDKKNTYLPRLLDTSKQFWRSFSSLFIENDESHKPGVIKWLCYLESNGVLNLSQIYLHAYSIKYKGTMKSAVVDVWDDSISINAKLLSSLGDEWVIRINASLEVTEELVKALGTLAVDMAEASGESFGSNEASKRRRYAHRDKSKENAYFSLDMPFRDWLASIDPRTDDVNKKINGWLDQAESIIGQLGREIAADAGIVAFVGKKTQEGMTSSKAFIKFRNTIFKIRKGS
jgi:CRISPR system Cascade subunit CasA